MAPNRTRILATFLAAVAAWATFSSPAKAATSPPVGWWRWPILGPVVRGRKGYHKTLIAIANKHARILWAMLAKDERYDAAAWQRHPMHELLLAGNA